ncbi:MAG: SprT family zinc-dependent metalloprotease [Methylovulum sp.]|uniref:M48 family metallopeptidase n=1 Tax=Methylovulum sp. TaxID=1916980 RepID=UPI0026028B28|nr:SprT family zinc-dependent metalloprotease [Methylovulum sp.]MDD2723655.1 SprT family zinc-dependent metalloprotease [Methylovulum sp.]MDD5123852.1 SprT family zinc-dependent metalloprotease [Methylovulum sp.]
MANLPFSYTIRRSARVSRMRIVVTQDKIEVVAPPNIAEKRLHQFVSEKQQWIMQAIEKVASKNQQAAFPVPAVYGEGVGIPYQGRHYSLVVVNSKLKRVKIGFAETLIAHIPETLAHDAHSEAIRPALSQWMKQQTQLRVEQLIHRHAPKKQLIPRSVIIKTQKSRWGSCGINNDININWLLIMAPPEVLEYVVVHELCHLKERNHSARFWALVAEHLPDYQQQRHWLKQQGGDLMRYGQGIAG